MSTCEIFTYEPIDACSLLYLSKFKYRNKDSSFKFSLSLSGGISLDVGTLDIDQTANNNEWDVFKTRGLHFVHSNKTSFLHKIEKLHRNAAAISWDFRIKTLYSIRKSKSVATFYVFAEIDTGDG